MIIVLNVIDTLAMVSCYGILGGGLHIDIYSYFKDFAILVHRVLNKLIYTVIVSCSKKSHIGSKNDLY